MFKATYLGGQKAMTYSLNSGVRLYFSNSSSQSACERGGRIPATGRHSVILRPDSVNRVTPPTTITAKTKAEEVRSHIATGGGESTGSSAASTEAEEALDEKNRGSNVRCCFTTPESGRFCVQNPFVRFETLLRARVTVRVLVCVVCTLRAGKDCLSPRKFDKSLVERPAEAQDLDHEVHNIVLRPLENERDDDERDGGESE